MTRVLFSCPVCRLLHAEVEVRDRDPGEPRQEYLREVGKRVKIAHAVRSFLCNSKKVGFKIPGEAEDN